MTSQLQWLKLCPAPMFLGMDSSVINEVLLRHSLLTLQELESPVMTVHGTLLFLVSIDSVLSLSVSLQKNLGSRYTVVNSLAPICSVKKIGANIGYILRRLFVQPSILRPYFGGKALWKHGTKWSSIHHDWNPAPNCALFGNSRWSLCVW
jgi:hypothetical protein